MPKHGENDVVTILFHLTKLETLAEILNMKAMAFMLKLLFIVGLALYAGCSSSPSDTGFPFDFAKSGAIPCERYGPARIDILPLTTLTPAPDSEHDSILNVYVCLLDSFDSQIKSPAVFRFELFEHAQRSTDPKGKRLTIWPDTALTDPVINNNHWQDFLRAYQFSLPVQKLSAGDYILHTTCITPADKRLSADFLIRSAK